MEDLIEKKEPHSKKKNTLKSKSKPKPMVVSILALDRLGFVVSFWICWLILLFLSRFVVSGAWVCCFRRYFWVCCLWCLGLLFLAIFLGLLSLVCLGFILLFSGFVLFGVSLVLFLVFWVWYCCLFYGFVSGVFSGVSLVLFLVLWVLLIFFGLGISTCFLGLSLMSL